MNKPYYKTLMLGVSVKELVDYILDEIGSNEYLIWGEYGGKDRANGKIWWEDLIKNLAASKDKNIRFIEEEEYEDHIEVFAPKLTSLDSIYYDSDTYHHAEDDVIKLNNFVNDFYGTKTKAPKAKITSEEYASSPKCPVCKTRNKLRQRGNPWVVAEKAYRNLSCDKCNSTWQETFLIASFSDLSAR